MKYMLLIYGREADITPAEWTECVVESSAICHDLAMQGKFLAASPLHPVATATSVRLREGKRLITDGPFAETTEQLGGYYIIDVADLDEAIAVASRLPPVRTGTVEIRPVVEIPTIPIPEVNEILTYRDLPFPRDQVYTAFADPERLARWWGPAGFSNQFETFDLRAGGDWRFTMIGPDGATYLNESTFQVIDAPHRIVFDHISAPKFRMTMTWTELPGSRTRLVWVMRFESVEMRDRLYALISRCNPENYDRLHAELERVPAEVA